MTGAAGVLVALDLYIIGLPGGGAPYGLSVG